MWEAIDAARYGERIGFAADELQKQVLRGRADRLLLNCTRQWGKSTVCALAAVHTAVMEEGSLILVASPSLRQSGEFVRKAAGFLRAAGEGFEGRTTELRLKNGSRIVGLPGREGTIRGFSGVRLLLIDEAARVEDELYQALRPVLAVSKGALWMLSTPFGRRGFFWREWSKGEGWTRVTVTAADCPRIPKAFLEEERKAQGERWFAQEYMGEFLGEDGCWFDRELLEQAVDDEVEAL
jgi:hypothetical protein